jgi:hypothetical protein
VRSALILCAALAGCAAPAPVVLQQDAYVWQRSWTAPVRDAVAGAPAELGGLRVLAAEVATDGALQLFPLDAAALAAAHRPITLVVRIDGAGLPRPGSAAEWQRGVIDGARPMAGLSLGPVAAEAARLHAVGLEVDHDCGTAHLADYAAWLAAERPAGLRYSITALPAWATSPELPAVAAAVDELVVQVHAVRAPVIFEPEAARRGLARFAAAVPSARLRVALPDYQVVLGGRLIAADAATVAAFADELARDPIAGVRGIVWFRLPVAGDDDTWTAETFAAVVAHRAPKPSAAVVALRERGPGRYDVVVTNGAAEPAALPDVRLAGDVTAAELVDGYAPHGDQQWTAPHRTLAAGASQAIGWVRGDNLHVQ